MIHTSLTPGLSAAATELGDWNDIVCKVFDSLTVDNEADRFEGALEIRRAGGLDLARVASMPAIVRRAKPTHCLPAMRPSRDGSGSPV